LQKIFDVIKSIVETKDKSILKEEGMYNRPTLRMTYWLMTEIGKAPALIVNYLCHVIHKDKSNTFEYEDHTYVCLSKVEIAYHLGLSERHVSRILKRFVETNLLIDRKMGRSHGYAFNIVLTVAGIRAWKQTQLQKLKLQAYNNISKESKVTLGDSIIKDIQVDNNVRQTMQHTYIDLLNLNKSNKSINKNTTKVHKEKLPFSSSESLRVETEKSPKDEPREETHHDTALTLLPNTVTDVPKAMPTPLPVKPVAPSPQYTVKEMYEVWTAHFGSQLSPSMTKRLARLLGGARKFYFATKESWERFCKRIKVSSYLTSSKFTLSVWWVLNFTVLTRLIAGEFGVPPEDGQEDSQSIAPPPPIDETEFLASSQSWYIEQQKERAASAAWFAQKRRENRQELQMPSEVVHAPIIDNPLIKRYKGDMAGVAQLVRAPDCGSGGRRFETGHSPHIL
jgi:DNA-binding MarR family transcriptional regulator